MLSVLSTIAISDSEHRTITDACGVIDRSERGKLALSGAHAKAFLQGQVTNDVEALSDGTGCYAAFLTPKGKMLGDVRILATSDELLLDTERVALQSLFNMIRRFSLGFQVELHKRTLERGLLSLVGPESDAVAAAGELPLDEHAHREVVLAGVQARAIRTDVGIDLLCDAAETVNLLAAVERAGAARVSEDTVECLRVEHGRPRYGVDLDDTVIPEEAGLNARAVSFTKGCYVGQETVARLHYRGKPNRHLRGLRLEAAVRSGDEVEFDGRAVGRVTSTARSPRFGAIALSLIRREAPPGTAITVGATRVPGEVVELPFA